VTYEMTYARQAFGQSHWPQTMQQQQQPRDNILEILFDGRLPFTSLPVHAMGDRSPVSGAQLEQK
jgi:hypothetical protein